MKAVSENGFPIIWDKNQIICLYLEQRVALNKDNKTLFIIKHYL